MKPASVKTCRTCGKWIALPRNAHPFGFCGHAIPTDETGICAYEITLGIMRTRPKWRQGDDATAQHCEACETVERTRKTTKHGKEI